jgi:hypothetical protein
MSEQRGDRGSVETSSGRVGEAQRVAGADRAQRHTRPTPEELDERQERLGASRRPVGPGRRDERGGDRLPQPGGTPDVPPTETQPPPERP